MRVDEVEGIGPVNAGKLDAVGITTVDDLVRECGPAGGRHYVAEETGISEHKLLEWTNRCDLMRIPGVGSEYSDLLEAVGVDSPRELAQRNPANLAAAISRYDAEHPNVVRRVPSEATIEGWIRAADSLAKVVTH
jgi:predicted flap endonuclease-1-like 5' DNA nuclease